MDGGRDAIVDLEPCSCVTLHQVVLYLAFALSIDLFPSHSVVSPSVIPRRPLKRLPFRADDRGVPLHIVELMVLRDLVSSRSYFTGYARAVAISVL